jgi:hypothetical protein
VPYSALFCGISSLSNAFQYQLIEQLRKVDPVYGDIFQMLYDEKTQQEIADNIGKNRRIVSDAIKKVRKLAQTSDLYEK